MAYSAPDNTEKVLYLELDYSDRSFDSLFERIAEHFGEERKLNEFTISTKRLQTSGCSCHPEYSDYTVYTVIELVEPFTNVNSTTLRALLEP